ncbi:hypothetical protein PPACK8108_LOCUS4385 [Phakopsora pachyrhizi]|uniref:Uncharacterized protein n=1 Tax=Phakopsora pachyrhizi TaxID=170000 RepID=A0AAV0AN87_PHAPC|nr:hypothetical protein PPACK8108_LOCUS4385 [Phakopsora pachyrhizi]
MALRQGCVLLKLSTPFILTGPSESSASKPYHSVHQQNSGCWKLEQPGWLWVNHLSTLCSVSSSSAWVGHIHQPADLRLRLESTLATLREIYQVRGLGDGQGLGLTNQVVILHWGDPRNCGWPDLTGAIRLQQSGDPQSVLVSLPSGMVSDLLELLPSDLVATCQNPLTECLPTRASVRQQQGTLSVSAWLCYKACSACLIFIIRAKLTDKQDLISFTLWCTLFFYANVLLLK